ncbi:MAG: hypothetical protein HY862_12495 [Chloroflexi bacterium]|nr:hypothetical protein [Chloroflexota bacterium]
MNVRKILVVVIAALTVLAVLPAQAQEGEDLLGIVTTAFTNLNGLQGYQATTESEQSQTVSSGEGYLALSSDISTEQSLTAQVRPAKEGQTEASSITIEQSNSIFIDDTTDNTNPTRQTINLEVVQIDGQIYVRIPTDVEGLFPASDWVNISENPDVLPLGDSFNFANIANLSGISGKLFTADTVTTVEEGANEGISGQIMRVFTLTMNPSALFSSVDGATLLGLKDANDPVTQAVLAAMTVQYTIWVGADDNLPHRLQATINVDIELGSDLTGGDAAKVVITSDATTDYSAFDEPVDIQVPTPAPVETGDTGESTNN